MSAVPRCKKCGRVLKDPLSIALGIGPDCRNARSTGRGRRGTLRQSSNRVTGYGGNDSPTAGEQVLIINELDHAPSITTEPEDDDSGADRDGNR